MLHRTLQALALLVAIGTFGFLACRAQNGAPPAGNATNPAAGDPDAAPAIDAAAPEVYFPASKSGGAFLQHQQAPR
jgi:hypothetical protein